MIILERQLFIALWFILGLKKVQVRLLVWFSGRGISDSGETEQVSASF